MALLDRFPALAGVDLSVSAGEVVGIAGPNGAGKTTLLRACAGLVPLRAKRAEVLGFDLLADRRAVRRHVGLLGHRAPLYGDLRVADQLRHCAALLDADASEVSSAAERFGLGGRLESVAIRRLSEGQQRRVALACLTIARPRLWLLDEPHAGLDASSRAALDELLAGAAAAGASTRIHTRRSKATEGSRCRCLAACRNSACGARGARRGLHPASDCADVRSLAPGRDITG